MLVGGEWVSPAPSPSDLASQVSVDRGGETVLLRGEEAAAELARRKAAGSLSAFNRPPSAIRDAGERVPDAANRLAVLSHPVCPWAHRANLVVAWHAAQLGDVLLAKVPVERVTNAHDARCTTN